MGSAIKSIRRQRSAQRISSEFRPGFTTNRVPVRGSGRTLTRVSQEYVPGGRATSVATPSDTDPDLRRDGRGTVPGSDQDVERSFRRYRAGQPGGKPLFARRRVVTSPVSPLDSGPNGRGVRARRIGPNGEGEHDEERQGG